MDQDKKGDGVSKKGKKMKKQESDKQAKATKAKKENTSNEPQTTAVKEKEPSQEPTSARARKAGDIWWDNSMQKAIMQCQDGVEVSSAPYVQDDAVVVAFKKNEISWRVPHLIPGDLKRFEKGADLPETGTVQPKKPKTKAKPKVQKPVPDYELPTSRCKYATQGKNAPLIKIECKEDRFDLNSRMP